MTHAGRNDPCPCGSGLKYKKCCLPKEEGSPEKRHRIMVRAEERLRDKIHRFACSSRFDDDLAEAFRIYFDGKYDIKDPDESPPEVAQIRFYDWYLFDYRLSEWEKPPIQAYQEVRAYNLDDDERHILEEWQQTVTGVFEVVSADAEEGSIELKHLLTGESFDVTDDTIIDNIQAEDLCVTRLIRLGDTHIFSGAYTRMAPDARDDCLAYLNSRLEEMQKEQPEAGWSEFFSGQSHLLNHYLTKIEEKAKAEEAEAESDSEEPSEEEAEESAAAAAAGPSSESAAD